MIRFLQINLHTKPDAQALAQQTAAERGIQVLLVSEQNWTPANDPRWKASDDRTCAVVLTTSADFCAQRKGAGRGFGWIERSGVRMYSCYTSRNDSEHFEAFLDELAQSVRSADPFTQVVVGGDEWRGGGSQERLPSSRRA